jgi:hypothetical protein
MKKKIIIVYGNCQAQMLAECLTSISFLHNEFEVIWERNFEDPSLPQKKELSRLQLENCAYLFEQVGNKDKVFPNIEWLPSHCMQIRFPYLKIESLWPLMDLCDPRNKPEPPKYDFGRFPQGDKFVTDMIKKNIPRETIFEEYKKINILGKI